MTKIEILLDLVEFAMDKKKQKPEDFIEKLRDVSKAYDKL